MNKIKKSHSYDQAKLKYVSDALCDNIEELLDTLGIEGYKNLGKLIAMSCPVHGGDNESALKLWEKGHSTAKETKHIETRYFYIADLAKRRIVTLEHIGTDDQLADILTKGLPEERFKLLRDRLYGSYSKLHEIKRKIVYATQTVVKTGKSQAVRKVKFTNDAKE